MATAKKAESAANNFDAFASINPEAFKEGYEKFAEGVSAVADYNKGALEAVIAAAGAYSKGVEKLTAENAEFVKASYERAVSAGKAVTGAKSAQEAFDIQSDFARESVEKNLNQANKVADLWIDTTKETVAPLTERYSELVEKIQSYRP